VQSTRRRIELGKVEQPCALCGSADVVAVESRSVRRGFARINPAWRPVTRTYDICRRCGAKHLTADGRRI
jgi:hypothetical protein